ncbi:hypothetical protein DL93DRAFT_2226625 [Clavulina sp. PMI_390]|nr:hypothetical protein DL93DRAFT_2226625 [Clavulina sp. PMI_390]
MDLQPFLDYLEGQDIQGRSLTSFLEIQAVSLAKGHTTGEESIDASDYRVHVGDTHGIWDALRSLWEKVAATLFAQQLSVGSEDEPLAVTLGLARFVRNLVAGNPENQSNALQAESSIRKVLHYFTAYSQSLTEASRAVTRMLTQMSANIVTGNDATSTQFWNSEISSRETQNVLIRLLTFPDDGTKMATGILVLNMLKGSYWRSHQLASTVMGRRIFITILDQLASSFEGEADLDNAGDGFFGVAFASMQMLIGLSLSASLYGSIAIKDEPSTPQQISFLKVLDAHLQSQSSMENRSDAVDFLFLIPAISGLVHYARGSVKRVLPAQSPAPSSTASPVSPSPTTNSENQTEASPALLHSPDLKLPSVMSSVVLVSQCILKLSMNEVDGGRRGAEKEIDPVISTAIKQGVLIEDIIHLLRLLDHLLPRILWGKAQPSAHQQTANTPSAPATGPLNSPLDPSADDTTMAFSYVKRDLVRLVGLMTYHDKAVQDRLRACGGIHAILNLCVVDERNPFMREHALFALNNALEGNSENQEVVAELKPMGAWDADGVLRDIPGSIRR